MAGECVLTTESPHHGPQGFNGFSELDRHKGVKMGRLQGLEWGSERLSQELKGVKALMARNMNKLDEEVRG